MTGNLLISQILGVLLEGDFNLIGLLQPFSISLSGEPLTPKDVQIVYQSNRGIFFTLIRSDIVTICTCLDLDHAWVLIAYLC
jgi:hypothetical protein